MTPEEHIDAIILGVMEDVAGEIVDDVQQALSTAYPPASSPGEFPHRRSGLLVNSVTSAVEQFGSVTILTVISNAPYSAHLEYGTERMDARPFMGPTRDEWAPVIHQRFTSAFSTGGLRAAA